MYTLISREKVHRGRGEGTCWLYTCSDGKERLAKQIESDTGIQRDIFYARVRKYVKIYGEKRGVCRREIFGGVRPKAKEEGNRIKAYCGSSYIKKTMSNDEARWLLKKFLDKRKPVCPPFIDIPGYEPVLVDGVQ